MDNRMLEVIRRMKTFDWFSDRSDDYNKWREGMKELGRIRTVVSQINDPALTELYKAYQEYAETGTGKPDVATYFPDYQDPAEVKVEPLVKEEPVRVTQDPEAETVSIKRRPWPKSRGNKLKTY